MKGTIEQRSPGVYRLRVYVGKDARGNPRFVTRTHRGPKREHNSGLKAAENALNDLLVEVQKGQHDTPDATFGELIERWLTHCEGQDLSPTTLSHYRSIAKRVVVPELGTVRLSKLSARHLDALYAKLTAAKKAPTTVRRVHALISVALHQAEKWGMVERNVARQASPPPVRLHRVQPPTPEQVRAIITKAEESDPVLAGLILLAALTGARRGELCALRWFDVDFDAGRLTISRSIYEPVVGGGWAEKSTKTHAERRLSLDAVSLAVLRRQEAQAQALAVSVDEEVGPDSFVFSGVPNGSQPIMPGHVTKFAIRAAKACGIKTHLHMLRHFSATQAIAAGFDPVTVAKRLGHADSSITMRVYSHALEERDRALADTLGNVLTAKADDEQAELTA